MLVFLPLTPHALHAWASGEPLRGVRGFAATPTFLAAFGLTPADDEDAERTLLHIAGLDGLVSHGVRLVGVVDAAARDLATDFGGVEVAEVAFASAVALFTDEADAAASVAKALADLGDGDLAAAWDSPAHEALMADADLLWFGPDEWEHLPG